MMLHLLLSTSGEGSIILLSTITSAPSKAEGDFSGS